MKNTGFFNNLQVIALGLLLFVSGIKAADVYDANRIALERAGLVSQPIMSQPNWYQNAYERAAALGTAAKERATQFGAAAVNPETYRAMGRGIQSGASQTWQGLKSAGSTAMNRETYKPLFQRETYEKAGRAVYQGAGSAYQWSKENPKISIPLGVALVGGIIVGTYYSTVIHMTPDQKKTAQAYIALDNQFYTTIDKLVQLRDVRLAVATLGGNIKNNVSKTGLFSIHKGLEDALQKGNAAIMSEFDKSTIKQERMTKLPKLYYDLKKSMKVCLAKYIENATGDTQELQTSSKAISEEMEKALNSVNAELVKNEAAAAVVSGVPIK